MVLDAHLGPPLPALLGGRASGEADERGAAARLAVGRVPRHVDRAIGERVGCEARLTPEPVLQRDQALHVGSHLRHQRPGQQRIERDAVPHAGRRGQQDVLGFEHTSAGQRHTREPIGDGDAAHGSAREHTLATDGAASFRASC